MSFTAAQLSAIQTTERVMSCFSILGSFLVISTFLASSAFHKPINRLVFYASWGNLATSVGTLISLSGIAAGVNSPLCQLQGFIIQMFMPADSLWTLTMAVNVYLTLFHRFSACDLRQQEWKYLILCYGIPFIPAITFVFVETEARGKIFGAATLWCWITIKWNVLRIAAFYGPVWVVLIATACIYAVVGRVVYQNHRLFRSLSSSSALSEPSLSSPDSHRPKPTEIQITSSHHQTTSAAPPQDDPANPTTPYTATIASGPTAPPIAPPDHTTPRKRRLSNTDRAAWAYMRIALLFFAALLITWVPSTVNRVYGLAHGENPIFPLNYIEAVVMPLQGFWNAVIYFSTSVPACRALGAKIAHPRRAPLALLPLAHRRRSRE